MRFITANLNGIRSAANKGFFDWLPLQNADAVGVQEVKAQTEHVDGSFCTHGKLKGHFHYAEKKGYSGVGLYTNEEPSDLIRGKRSIPLSPKPLIRTAGTGSARTRG